MLEYLLSMLVVFSFKSDFVNLHFSVPVFGIQHGAWLGNPQITVFKDVSTELFS